MNLGTMICGHPCSLEFPLMEAAGRGDLNLVKQLIAQGANPYLHSKGALYNAVMFGRINVVRYLIEQYGIKISSSPSDDAIIRRAVERGHLDITEYLIEQGASVEAALKEANDCYIVKHLITKYGKHVQSDLLNKISQKFNDPELNKLITIYQVMAV